MEIVNNHDYWSFLLASALRHGDAESFIATYDQKLPKTLTKEEVNSIKQKAYELAELNRIEFIRLELGAQEFVLTEAVAREPVLTETVAREPVLTETVAREPVRTMSSGRHDFSAAGDASSELYMKRYRNADSDGGSSDVASSADSMDSTEKHNDAAFPYMLLNDEEQEEAISRCRASVGDVHDEEFDVLSSPSPGASPRDEVEQVEIVDQRERIRCHTHTGTYHDEEEEVRSSQSEDSPRGTEVEMQPLQPRLRGTQYSRHCNEGVDKGVDFPLHNPRSSVSTFDSPPYNYNYQLQRDSAAASPNDVRINIPGSFHSSYGSTERRSGGDDESMKSQSKPDDRNSLEAQHEDRQRSPTFPSSAQTTDFSKNQTSRLGEDTDRIKRLQRHRRRKEEEKRDWIPSENLRTNTSINVDNVSEIVKYIEGSEDTNTNSSAKPTQKKRKDKKEKAKKDNAKTLYTENKMADTELSHGPMMNGSCKQSSEESSDYNDEERLAEGTAMLEQSSILLADMNKVTEESKPLVEARDSQSADEEFTDSTTVDVRYDIDLSALEADVYIPSQFTALDEFKVVNKKKHKVHKAHHQVEPPVAIVQPRRFQPPPTQSQVQPSRVRKPVISKPTEQDNSSTPIRASTPPATKAQDYDMSESSFPALNTGRRKSFSDLKNQSETPGISSWAKVASKQQAAASLSESSSKHSQEQLDKIEPMTDDLEVNRVSEEQCNELHSIINLPSSLPSHHQQQTEVITAAVSNDALLEMCPELAMRMASSSSSIDFGLGSSIEQEETVASMSQSWSPASTTHTDDRMEFLHHMLPAQKQNQKVHKACTPLLNHSKNHFINKKSKPCKGVEFLDGLGTPNDLISNIEFGWEPDNTEENVINGTADTCDFEQEQTIAKMTPEASLLLWMQNPSTVNPSYLYEKSVKGQFNQKGLITKWLVREWNHVRKLLEEGEAVRWSTTI